MLPLGETPLNEENEAFVKTSDSGNKKLDIGKHIEVQVAQETRSVSIGKLVQTMAIVTILSNLKPRFIDS